MVFALTFTFAFALTFVFAFGAAFSFGLDVAFAFAFGRGHDHHLPPSRARQHSAGAPSEGARSGCGEQLLRKGCPSSNGGVF